MRVLSLIKAMNHPTSKLVAFCNEPDFDKQTRKKNVYHCQIFEIRRQITVRGYLFQIDTCVVK